MPSGIHPASVSASAHEGKRGSRSRCRGAGENLLTAKPLAELLGTRTNTVYDLAAAGQLPSFKIPGVGRRFRASDVEAWLDRHAEPAKR
jgi:excisionase family DNA binding protein